MAIPDFQTVMLPFLTALSDGKEWKMKDLTSALAEHFNLTEEERSELLPSGYAPLFYNRVAWAKTHLKNAGLVDNPTRGRVTLSARGSEVVAQNPKRVDMKLLRRFDEYREFVKGSSKAKSDSGQDEPNEDATPLESLEEAYKELRVALADELLDRLISSSPKFFEHVVVTLLRAMGYGGRYGSSEVTSYVRDGGIDGVIREDKLGLDIVCIQAKRWKGTVGRPEVQAFVGSMDLVRAKKGVILTTGRYSKDATEFLDRIEGKRVVLIDGQELTELMIEHDIGVTTDKVYKLKEVSNDFFEDDEALG